MELRNLITFIHVAELGSFTKAAAGYCNSDWTAADANGVRRYTLNGSTNFAYIRVSGAFGANPIVTVDENIG